MSTAAPALVSTCGQVIPLAVDRWHAPADAVERALLATVDDAVLDVGCGPGRIVAELARQGRVALGVDTSPAAVAATRRRGAAVLRRSAFDPLPGEGRWGSVLLLDGNVGIGGDPVALLARCAGLLRPGGQVVVEVEPPGVAARSLTVRLESAATRSRWFPWAQVGTDDVADLAVRAGLRPLGRSEAGGRWFARAVRP
ncbi:MAG TPA: class I SAM-dependent methyltransferase [Acidimicrobiales bacterium]